MKIVLLFNPRSGGAARRSEVEGLGASLRAGGHEVELAEVGGPPLLDLLRGAGLLVVAGGDGTLHHSLNAASRAGVPVYHWPLGTENLFARQFGMTRSATALARAIDAGRVVEVDLGACDDRPFAIMCSVGPDAAVIHRMHATRKGSIRRTTYLGPIWRELAEPPARLRVWVDGDLAVDGQRGMVVVANGCNYGFGFNPAAMAAMDDGLLDCVFLPADSAWGALWWLCKARVGRHVRDPRLVYRTGREIVVANAGDAPALAQCDGEATGTLACGGGAGCAVQLVVRQRALKVLTVAPGQGAARGAGRDRR